MGDIKKFTNKYETPSHPWRLERIETEKALRKEYGLKNSRELWKVSSKVKNFKDQAKNFARMAPAQAAKERAQLEGRLAKYGLLPEDSNLEIVLEYTPKQLLERRLQTILVRKGLCRSMKQARQFITHRHVLVNGRCVTAPGYLVPLTEESTISFKANSSLADDQHAERISLEAAAAKREAEREARKRLEEQKQVEEEVIQITEEDNVE